MADSEKKNFFLWGSWGGQTVTRPLLTEKIRGNVKKTIIGQGFVLALRTDGILCSWGEDRQGCLGLGQEKLASVDPKKINIPEKVADVSFGNKHVLALTVSGRVYSFGLNEYGQLGLGKFQYYQLY